MKSPRYALLSVFTKDSQFLQFATFLVSQGYKLVSSGGTAKFLLGNDLEVTDVEELTGFPPMLKHRVVTLAPQVHAGLIATDDMLSELEEHDLIKFDLLYVTFYPLEEEMAKQGTTLQSCIDSTDIGGPTMVASACKSRRMIVMTGPQQVRKVTDWMKSGCADPEEFCYELETEALQACADYAQLSADVRQSFTLTPADVY